jgi:D-arabinose 1-dehydrogenase-like Zn-dependent alcohol dehydrogenase
MQSMCKGGHLVVVGLFGGGLQIPLVSFPLQMLTIQGSYVGTLQDLEDVVALAQAGKIHDMPVVGRPISEVNAILNELKDGKVDGRVVLKP